MNYQIQTFDQLDSTNTYIKNNPSTVHGWVVRALEQTAGRGRHGRTWQSVKGEDLAFSVQLDVHDLDPSKWPLISLLSCTVLSRFLQEHGIEHFLKWPNDLVCANRKLSGILCEAYQKQGRNFVVVGIGININSPASQWDIPTPGAISLAELTNKSWDCHKSLCELMNHFMIQWNRFIGLESPNWLIHFFESRMLGIKQWINWQGGGLNQVKKIQILGIESSGELRVCDLEKTWKIQSGELSWKDLIQLNNQI